MLATALKRSFDIPVFMMRLSLSESKQKSPLIGFKVRMRNTTQDYASENDNSLTVLTVTFLTSLILGKVETTREPTA